MSFDSGSFDPNKVGGNYSQNQGGKKPADQGQPQESAPQAGDPYAEQRLDPNSVLDYLATSSRANLPAELQNPSVVSSVNAFTSQFSPDDYDAIVASAQAAYRNEFGADPSPALLQEIVDNHIIGVPVIAV